MQLSYLHEVMSLICQRFPTVGLHFDLVTWFLIVIIPVLFCGYVRPCNANRPWWSL